MRNQILGAIRSKTWLFILTFSLASRVAVAQTMTVYNDTLVNGWQDYGYASDNYFNSFPVHSGIYSISVTITAPFQGLQIHHADFTNTAYHYLTFWLNGGPIGGQHLRVYGVLGGVNQSSTYPLSPPSANAWQQYTVPLSGFGVANTTNFDAFVIQDALGAAQPVFYVDDIQLSAVAPAVTFTTLFTFAPYPEEGDPRAGLILASNTLYGTTYYGGTNHVGMVFQVNTDGTGFKDIYSCPNDFSAGYLPSAGLVLSSNTLYGTTPYGANYPLDGGTVFAVNTDGTGFTNLYAFSDFNNSYQINSDGAQPYAGLVLASNTLYGTTKIAGLYGNGTIFAIHTDGTGFTNLHTFTATTSAFVTNSDGAHPQAGLVLGGSTLYGTTFGGGTNGKGTVFAINTDGSDFTNLHNFTYLSDGANPAAGLVLSGNTLYGTANTGGTNGNGSVFAVNTDGSGFKNVYSFSGFTSGANSDGAGPQAGLILSGNTLYGTTTAGGYAGRGTVFEVNTDGTDFATLHSFNATSLNALSTPTNSDGFNSQAALVLAGNTLYGTASFGGTNAYGTVFSITLPVIPQLTINRSGTNVILTWPTNATGYTLQFATNLVSPAIWNTNLPAPVVVKGQNAVTNGISGTRKFYRLNQ